MSASTRPLAPPAPHCGSARPVKVNGDGEKGPLKREMRREAQPPTASQPGRPGTGESCPRRKSRVSFLLEYATT